MLKIKSLLLGLLTFSVFSISLVSAQAYCPPTDYYCTNNSYTTYSPYGNSTQKYPELCSVLSRTLAVGDTGNDVKRLQIALGQEGIAYIGSTGYFGPVTKGAVQIFQLRNGIRQTGAVGPLTLAKIRTLWCGGQSGNSGNTPTGYINTNNSNQYNTGTNGQLEVSIAPISSSYANITLGWNSKFANSCDINGENVQVNGQKILSLFNETTYTITCVGYNGARVTKSIVLKPNQAISNLPTINLSINPTTALINTYATLYWTSTNSYSCTLNSQSVPTSGSQQILVTGSQTAYQLACMSASGQQVSSTVYANPGGNTNINISSANIYANLSTVNSGQPVTLTWNSNNTSSCSVTGGTTTFSGTNGSQVVYPTQTTTYSVACYGLSNGPQVTNQVLVTVNGTGGNGTGNVTISTNPINVGGVENIAWNISTTTSPQGVLLSLYDSNNVFYGHITRINTYSSNSSFSWTIPKVVFDSSNDGLTCITVDGQQFCGGSPKQIITGSYKVRATLFTPSNACFGFCQQVSGQQILGTYDSAIFTINASTNTNNITATLNSNPNYVYSGQASLLSWSSANATYCNILNSTGATIASNQSTSGTYSVYPTVSGNYQITCFNGSGQSISDYEFITVNGGTTGNVTSTITATPNPVATGQAVTLSWTSTNANYCNIVANSNNILSNQSTSGSTVVYPAISTNYQINCYNNNGQNGANFVYVTTNNTTAVPTANIYASSQNVTSGQSLTLNWYSSNANTCSLYGNNNLLISNQNTSGSYLVYPTQTTNYQITCTNNSSGQTANNYVTVTVNGSTSGNNLTLISSYNRLVTVQINNSSCASGGYISWGDGQASQVPNQCGNITLTHQYSYTGNFNLNLSMGSINSTLQVYVQ